MAEIADLEKDGALHLNKLESPSPKETTDNRQIVIRKAHWAFGSGELKTSVPINGFIS